MTRYVGKVTLTGDGAVIEDWLGLETFQLSRLMRLDNIDGLTAMPASS